VVLSVEDTGPAVPADELSAIFQPFAASREGSRGAGIGLTISFDLVAALHGHMEVTNREEGGAAFRIVLPRAADGIADREGPSLGSTQPPADLAPDTRRLLVVDEDDLFARTVRRGLRPHDVRSATTASEAEIALLDPSFLPHLVLCDLALPGMTGDMLHARIQQKRPEVAQKFVFVATGESSQSEAEYVRASGRPILRKPFDVREIWSLLNLPAPGANTAVATPGVPAQVGRSDTEPAGPPRRRSRVPTRPRE
jgi:CheY-like chemotaxis protein